MAGRTPSSPSPAPRDPSTDGGPAACASPFPEAQGRATLLAGRALVQTVRQFFSPFNAWLDRLPDTRVQEDCTYVRRFLAEWGLALYLLQLSSRRQLDNADAGPSQGRRAEEIKQDCELKALHRLLPRIKKTYPQLRFILAMDALYACGPVFALVQKMGWSFVVTFKEGRLPTLWREFRTLLPLCPEQYLRRDWVDRPVQEFRWVKDLSYQDREGRWWKLHALDCTATAKDGPQHYFAWLTWLPIGKKTVEAIAQKGGRDRWKIENEGFNRQKNSGLNLPHVYSTDPDKRIG
jgi:hypothetical protein